MMIGGRLVEPLPATAEVRRYAAESLAGCPPLATVCSAGECLARGMSPELGS